MDWKHGTGGRVPAFQHEALSSNPSLLPHTNTKIYRTKIFLKSVFYLVVLVIKPRASVMLIVCLTAKLHPQLKYLFV
jgi:hypothetical protein